MSRVGWGVAGVFLVFVVIVAVGIGGYVGIRESLSGAWGGGVVAGLAGAPGDNGATVELAVELLGDRLSDTLQIFAMVLSVFTGIVAILVTVLASVPLLVYTNELHRVEGRLKEAKVAVEESIRSEIAWRVDDEVEQLFQQRFRREILEWTALYAKEALLQSPQVRGVLVARFRSAAREVRRVMVGSGYPELADGLYDAFGSCVEDWHTVGQVLSSDREEVRTGLSSLRAKPFVEMKPMVTKLMRRYADDAEISLLLEAALRAILEME